MLKPVFGFVLLCGLLTACKDKKKEKEEIAEAPASLGLSNLFKETKLPYQLVDTGLANNKDTVTIPSNSIESLIPDSIKHPILEKVLKLNLHHLRSFTSVIRKPIT